VVHGLGLIAELQQRLAVTGYVADGPVATALVLMQKLGRPLLLEGDAGVGKTAVASALAQVLDTRLMRLQCYEGLDVSSAVYEWNYPHQLLSIRLQEQSGRDESLGEAEIFSERFLLRRPLLDAISQSQAPVLLIDEVDRADEEFEAFLLEVLSDFQVSIPELGTIRAVSRPHVILTSNGTRDLSDALRRRCLYHYLNYPSVAQEIQIIRTRIPDLDLSLARQIVGFVQLLRGGDLRKRPGVAETLDWTAALMALGVDSVKDDLDTVMSSLSCLLKTREDLSGTDRATVKRLLGAVSL
jgi:MoxR-like ATPase